MRKYFVGVLSMFCLVGAALPALAQSQHDCIGNIYSYGYSCVSGSCRGSGEVQSPTSGGSNSVIITPVYCCGSVVGTLIQSSGQYCPSYALKNPAIKDRLLELARGEGQEFIVANCTGTYAPVMDAFSETMPPLKERKTTLF